MFLSALNCEAKGKNLKSLSMMNSRSQSSLSNLSAQTNKPKHKTLLKLPLDLSSEVTLLSKNTHDLEEKIIQTMQEMKRLKRISKSLKSKEAEVENLNDLMQNSEKHINETKNKLERSEILMNVLYRNIVNNNNLALNELVSVISSHILRFKQKKGSLTIEDLILKPHTNKLSVKTTRESKLRSPYFSLSTFHIPGTPKLKKFQTIKSGASFHKIPEKTKEKP